jgi:hypothetical protein
VAHNTLINTAGITVRAGSRAELDGNLIEGRAWRRDGSVVEQRGTTPLGQWLDPAAAAALQWQWLQPVASGSSVTDISTDFNGQLRAGHYAPGAILP